MKSPIQNNNFGNSDSANSGNPDPAKSGIRKPKSTTTTTTQTPIAVAFPDGWNKSK